MAALIWPLENWPQQWIKHIRLLWTFRSNCACICMRLHSSCSSRFSLTVMRWNVGGGSGEEGVEDRRGEDDVQENGIRKGDVHLRRRTSIYLRIRLANVHFAWDWDEMETFIVPSTRQVDEQPINTSITIIELVQYKFKLKQIVLHGIVVCVCCGREAGGGGVRYHLYRVFQ